MADEEENQSEETPESLLKKVEKKAATNKILMIVVLSISGLLITVMATGMTVMFLRISALNEAANMDADDPMEEQFIALEQQLMLLADFRKSELKKIAAYTKQLEKIGNECSIEKSAPYREFLASREKDFQTLLATIKEGSANLANMNQGSKKWLEPHAAALDELKQSSSLRQSTLESLDK